MAKSRKRKPKKPVAKPANHDHEHAVLSLFVGVAAVLGMVMVFLGLQHPKPVSASVEVQAVESTHH